MNVILKTKMDDKARTILRDKNCIYCTYIVYNPVTHCKKC